MVRTATIVRFVPVYVFSDSIILDKQQIPPLPPPSLYTKEKEKNQQVTLRNSWNRLCIFSLMWYDSLVVHIVEGEPLCCRTTPSEIASDRGRRRCRRCYFIPVALCPQTESLAEKKQKLKGFDRVGTKCHKMSFSFGKTLSWKITVAKIKFIFYSIINCWRCHLVQRFKDFKNVWLPEKIDN